MSIVDHAVERHAFARPNLDKIADFDQFRGHLLIGSVSFHDACNGRHDGHQALDVAARLVNGSVLQGFADAVKQQHSHGFGIFTNEQGAQRRHRHQHELAEDVAVVGTFCRLLHHWPAHNEHGHGIVPELHALEPRHTYIIKRQAHSQHDGPGNDASPAAKLAVIVVVVVLMLVSVSMTAMLVMMFVLMMMSMATLLFVFLCFHNDFSLLFVFGCKVISFVLQPSCKHEESSKNADFIDNF